MNTHDDDLSQAFQNLRFADEPPMASTTADDVQRGRRDLRRRRVTTLASGVALVALVATGMAVALPGETGVQRTDVAGNPAGQDRDVGAPPLAELEDHDEMTQLVEDGLREHIDPDGDDLSLPAGTWVGGSPYTWMQLDPLAWNGGGEWDGSGVPAVTAVVAAPTSTIGEDWTDEDIRLLFKQSLFATFDPDRWTEQAGPGAGERLWIYDDSAGIGTGATDQPVDGIFSMRATLAAIHERDDGSMVALAAAVGQGTDYVVDITREQAVAFVTDPDIRILKPKPPAEGETVNIEPW